jgi:type I restriction enzyme S subunit
MYGQGLTRGRTAKLGIDASTNQACAVLFDIDNSIILTDYLWMYLMGEYDRLRELASGNSQPNLNAQMIKDYNVIIPSLEIQLEIVNSINSFKVKINEFKNLSKRNKEEAIIEFEKEIFN